jgi:TetR/AcrR family transcriptional regulator of autoinduction and epiphytic fitness
MDGRTARALRTREAIVTSLVELLREGAMQPSVEEIAARAGVSERSIFGHFHDREGLFAAVAEHQSARLREQWGEMPPPAAPLDERIEAFVEHRARIYEDLGPVRRAGLLMEPFSETTQMGVASMRSVKRREAWRLFGPELSEDHVLGAAVAALASFSGWDALRTQQGLSVDEAKAALRAGLSRMLRRP